jgi:hypothetical protein
MHSPLVHRRHYSKHREAIKNVHILHETIKRSPVHPTGHRSDSKKLFTAQAAHRSNSKINQ